MSIYRPLTASEIDELIAHQCNCDDWSQIEVKEGFTTTYIKHIYFSGHVQLGRFDKEITLDGGFTKHTGLSHATIHNCTIGDNVCIRRIQRYIANYTVDDDAYIENTELIATTGTCSFGNGTKVALLNEGGGREILITDKLSSHLAYIMTLYRHRTKTINALQNLIQDYCRSISSDKGYIGKQVRIISCHKLINVRIGEGAYIDGASELNNGSINSNHFDPVYIGQSVIAKNFIISSGTSVTDASLIENSFIGQGVQIGKHFSIYDSVYFCNSQGFHGEACAIFGGPFTVTHHKSSLLIAGMFSFLNAGSGSNQSNHMYKLGPIHQGIVERGSKTTSDSYILWPAKVGAFSLVMGRHHHHSDTSNLPFSYIIENNDATCIAPGVNLRSVGTIRDAQKWPKRDRRKDPEKLDQINFNLLSPFTIQKMYAGIDILNHLRQLSGEASETYSYQSTTITNRALQNGLKYYRMAIDKFLGNSLIKCLENTQFDNIEQLRNKLKPQTTVGTGDWVDLSGLIAPKTEISALMNELEAGKYHSIIELNEQLCNLHRNYYTYEWTWALQKLEKELNKPYTEFTADDIRNCVKRWENSVISLDEMLYEDAKKEFTLISKTGFGTDGDDKTKQSDFENVRGLFEENPFVKEVQQHIIRKKALGDELLSRIQHL